MRRNPQPLRLAGSHAAHRHRHVRYRIPVIAHLHRHQVPGVLPGLRRHRARSRRNDRQVRQPAVAIHPVVEKPAQILASLGSAPAIAQTRSAHLELPGSRLSCAETRSSAPNDSFAQQLAQLPKHRRRLQPQVNRPNARRQRLAHRVRRRRKIRLRQRQQRDACGQLGQRRRPPAVCSVHSRLINSGSPRVEPRRSPPALANQACVNPRTSSGAIASGLRRGASCAARNAPSSNGSPAWSSSSQRHQRRRPKPARQQRLHLRRRVAYGSIRLRHRRDHGQQLTRGRRRPLRRQEQARRAGTPTGAAGELHRRHPVRLVRSASSRHPAVSPAAAAARRRSPLPADRPCTPPSAAADGRRAAAAAAARPARTAGCHRPAPPSAPPPGTKARRQTRAARSNRVGRRQDLRPSPLAALLRTAPSTPAARTSARSCPRKTRTPHGRARRKRRGQRQHRLLRVARVVRVGRHRRLRKRHRQQPCGVTAATRSQRSEPEICSGTRSTGAAETLRTVSCACTSSRASAGVKCSPGRSR